MGFSRKIKYFLAHTLDVSNKEAQELLDSGQVQVDGIITTGNCDLSNFSEIRVNGNIIRRSVQAVYLMFNKPKGYESTLSKNVTGNLSNFFSEYQDLSIAGRLDKASEGLLLLSNDGKWIEALCHPDSVKEKEYRVVLEKHPDELFLQAFRTGIDMGPYLTKPCTCEITGNKKIKVILTEGKNRQIRRMAFKLGNYVIRLIRIRIANYQLDNLQPGQIIAISPDNISLQGDTSKEKKI